MRKFYLVGFLVLLCFDTMAQVAFKLGALQAAPLQANVMWLSRVATDGWVYLAMLGYLGAFVTYMTILKHAPIGPAFAATHLDIVTVCIVSMLWLGERLSHMQVFGGLLIICGVVLLGISETRPGTSATQPAPEAVVANTGKK